MSDSDTGHSSRGSARRHKSKFPKVKTGCRTCRIRRVKCDESKPECLRCIKFGGPKFCDGYDSQQKDRKPSVSGTLAPRILKAPPAPGNFQSDEELECLRFYTEETASELAGIVGGGFWPRLILQTGQRQPFIQSAIITIGALSKIQKIGGIRAESSFTPRMGMTEDEVALQQHYLFALQQYHKFIRGTRAHLTAQEDDKRVVLISCLLITCIERLQSHNQSAFTQARSGLKIMQEWIEEHAASRLVDDGRTMGHGNTIASVPGFSSPRPNIIEDEIVEQFRLLELSSLALITPHIARKGKFYQDEENALRNMPPAFNDLQDARMYFELILRRAYHFISETQRATNHVRPVFTITFSDEQNPVTDNLDLSGLSLLSLVDLNEEQRKHLAENKRWDDAFQHLFRHLNKSLSDTHQDTLHAALLSLRSTALKIRLGATTTTSEMVYDQYLPEFQRIVSLARGLVENSKSFRNGSFCFEQGFIFELSLVATSCRDRLLRREALEILESKDWREGTWGSRRVADGIRFLMETEEDGIEAEIIPELARARIVRIEVDVDNRRGWIQVMQGVATNTVVKSTVRDWSSFY